MTINLSAIEKRSKSATPGPWQVIPDSRPDVTTEQMIFTKSGTGGFWDEGQLIKRMHAGMRNDGNLEDFITHPENYVVRLHICELAKYYDQKSSIANSDDAEFIAHARTDIPALCAEVRELRKQVRQLKKKVKVR